MGSGLLHFPPQVQPSSSKSLTTVNGITPLLSSYFLRHLLMRGERSTAAPQECTESDVHSFFNLKLKHPPQMSNSCFVISLLPIAPMDSNIFSKLGRMRL